MEQSFRPLKDLVYDYISQKIASGELGDGDRVPEPMICEALGVSRTPVREALIQLATEGYLESSPRKGFRVCGVDEEGAVEIYQVIGPLDGEAAYLACPRLGEDDYRQLHFLVESMDLTIKNALFDRYDELQKEFHRFYLDRCGNHRLKVLLEAQERSFMRRGFSSVPRDEELRLLDKANAEHGHLVELFERGAADEARDYLRDVHWNTKNAQYTVW